MKRTAIAAGLSAVCLPLTAVPADSQELRTLRLAAVGCDSCTVSVEPWRGRGRLAQRVVLKDGKGQVRLPLDVGWYGVGITTRQGMSGGGATTLVVMNYAGFSLGDRVSNRRSKRAPFGTSCAYFYGDTTLRFKVRRDPLPKRYWDEPTAGGFRRYLRAWASPQQDSVRTDMYSPTNKGMLGTQNMACMVPGV